MKVLGIRFCSVNEQASEMAVFFDKLGLSERDLGAAEEFGGAVFPAGEHSWIEMWAAGPAMPAGVMLQIVVDDAAAFAEHARSQGLQPDGPVYAHGEQIYFLAAPGGLQVSFQSVVEE